MLISTTKILLLPDVRRMGQPLTYESVLLPSDRNKHLTTKNPSHQTASYAQIEIMLERMLSEVETQEKLFSLDLDVLENNSDHCVNELILEPSPDALIEIPINKPKIFEASHHIELHEHNHDLIGFEDPVAPAATANEPDFASFGESSSKVNQLAEIHESVKELLLKVEADESEMLLENIEENEQFSDHYKYPIYFSNAKRASSETLTDGSSDSWDDDCVDHDYEPIMASCIETRPFSYERFESKPDQIWYEGAYRNLSIVPEEDEETLSSPGKGVATNVYNKPNEYCKQYAQRSTSAECDTSSKNTDDGLQENVVKAEVKLLVKTSGEGKNEIEVCSVRDFLESPVKQKATKSGNKVAKKVTRSQTLPAKLTCKLSGFTNRMSNILNSIKSISKSTSTLSDIDIDTAEITTTKPVFTLQRLFLRTPECDGRMFVSNLQTAREQSKSRTELIATTNARFPLQLQYVDLYANSPFYPCYSEVFGSTAMSKNPFTEFVTNPFDSYSQVPQAYCDWLPLEEHDRGKVLPFPAKLIRMDLHEVFVVFITNNLFVRTSSH